MLRLVAENAALEDALYYLDLGVTDSVITVDVFLKEIRRLARKQFVARATMKKVIHSCSFFFESLDNGGIFALLCSSLRAFNQRHFTARSCGITSHRQLDELVGCVVHEPRCFRKMPGCFSLRVWTSRGACWAVQQSAIETSVRS